MQRRFSLHNCTPYILAGQLVIFTLDSVKQTSQKLQFVSCVQVTCVGTGCSRSLLIEPLAITKNIKR